MRHLMERRGGRATALRGMAMAVTAAAALAGSLGAARAADDDDEPGGFSEKFQAGVASAAGGFKTLFGMGKPQAPPQDPSPSGCPEITILDGTGASRIMANAAAGNEGVRYQYSIVDVGRECHLSGNQMTLKVGVAGKVLLGPAGTPGSFDVPVRIAVVDQLDQKPSVSKLYKVAASIPAGRTGTSYTLVADQLVIPFPAGRAAKEYTIKIGIDAGKGDAPAKPAKGRKAKPDAAAKPEAASTQ